MGTKKNLTLTALVAGALVAGINLNCESQDTGFDAGSYEEDYDDDSDDDTITEDNTTNPYEENNRIDINDHPENNSNNTDYNSEETYPENNEDILIDNMDSSSNFSVDGQQCKLDNNLLSWRLNNFTNDISYTDGQLEAIQSACQTWAEYLTIDCQNIIDQGQYVRVNAEFYPDNSICGPSSGIVACATYPCNSEQFLYYNDSWDFTLDLGEAINYRGKIDLESISLHEYGHLVGLNHSNDPDSVMYPYYHPLRELTNTDVEMLCELYCGTSCASCPQ